MRIRWKYFTIGALLALLVLGYQNRDLFEKPPLSFHDSFIQACVLDSTNPAYCACSYRLVQEIDPEWEEGIGADVYFETKHYLAILCMIDS